VSLNTLAVTPSGISLSWCWRGAHTR